MHGGTLTKCKFCPAVISLVQVIKPGERDAKWMPIDLPPVFGLLEGTDHRDRLVVPRLRKVVACTIITPEDAMRARVSDLILGSVPHWANCPGRDQARRKA